MSNNSKNKNKIFIITVIAVVAVITVIASSFFYTSIKNKTNNESSITTDTKLDAPLIEKGDYNSYIREPEID